MKLKSINLMRDSRKNVFIDLTASDKYDWNTHLIDGGVVKNALVFGGIGSFSLVSDPINDRDYALIGSDGNEVHLSTSQDEDSISDEVKDFLHGIWLFDQTDKSYMRVTWNLFCQKAKSDTELIEGLNSFLSKFGSSCRISSDDIPNYDNLCYSIENGELSLIEYCAWKSMLPEKKSFVVLDFPDAFLDFKSSRILFEDLNSLGCQTIMTTNNVTLLDNDITRPDCCFIATKDCVRSLEKSTDREIRFAHNLEKMYVNGVFG